MSILNAKERDIKRNQLTEEMFNRYKVLESCSREDVRNFQPNFNFTFIANLDSAEVLYNIGVNHLVKIKSIEEISTEEMYQTIDELTKEIKSFKSNIEDTFFEKENIDNPFYDAKCLLSIQSYLRNYVNLNRSFYNMREANRAVIRKARENAKEYYHNNKTASNNCKLKIYLEMCNYYKCYDRVIFSTLIKTAIEARIQCKKIYTAAGRFVKYN